jgi:hypothetical protein
LAAQLSQRAHLVAAERVRGRLAVLSAADVQRGGAAEVHLRPLEVGNLAGAEAVPISNEDQRRVTMAVAAAAGRRW